MTNSALKLRLINAYKDLTDSVMQNITRCGRFIVNLSYDDPEYSFSKEKFEKYSEASRSLISELLTEYYAIDNFDKWNEYYNILKVRMEVWLTDTKYIVADIQDKTKTLPPTASSEDIAKAERLLATHSFINYMSLYGTPNLMKNCDMYECKHTNSEVCSDCCRNAEFIYIPPDRFE